MKGTKVARMAANIPGRRPQASPVIITAGRNNTANKLIPTDMTNNSRSSKAMNTSMNAKAYGCQGLSPVIFSSDAAKRAMEDMVKSERSERDGSAALGTP